MILNRLNTLIKTAKTSSKSGSNKYIIILEDDPEQISILVDYTQNEIRKVIANSNVDDSHKARIQGIKIIKTSTIESLKRAVKVEGEIILALMDCNIPDKEGYRANDQFVKQNRVITGKHKSVDIVTKYSPDTKITMISSLNRFQKIIHNHYKKEHGLNINFISKKDPDMIKRNIGWSLRRYLTQVEA